MYIELVIIIYVVSAANCLSKFLDAYQKLDYRPLRYRSRRSLNTFIQTKLQFNSYNRTFCLLLRPLNEETSVFERDMVVLQDGIPVSVEQNDFLVYGYEKSDVNSKVYGSILDGIFDGHVIFSNGESFTIEKVGKYVSYNRKNLDFHSIIYSDSAISHPVFREKRSMSAKALGHCSLDGNVAEQMKSLQRIVTNSTSPFFQWKSKRQTGTPYKEEWLQNKDLYSGRTCSLYIQVDQLLFRMIYNREGNKDEIRTRQEIMNLINTHLQALNDIYQATNFKGITGINFIVQRISIFSPASCSVEGVSSGEKNPYCSDTILAFKFLEMNSRRNHSDFCLAYVLTYRDFDAGTLGLAWVASPDENSAGGICHRYSSCNMQKEFRSLNTGIITFVNFGSRILPRISQLTMAHEIGHNFGSPHDFPPECKPGLPDGNYLMFASATSGDKKNNAKFSECSLRNISLVLKEILRLPPIYNNIELISDTCAQKTNCFRPSKYSFCGNQLKEKGEECDCGFNQEECNKMHDYCCYPHDTGKGCMLKENSRCSVSQGECCESRTCTFVRAEDRRECHHETECTERQYCNGASAVCPTPENKRDGTLCQSSTKMCYGGSCNGSICESFGMRDCFLTKGSPAELCHLACMDENGTCHSSFNLKMFAPGIFKQSGRENLPGLLLLPGSPCNNYKGYCDIFQRCRDFESQSPLFRLKDTLFNPDTLEKIKMFIQVHRGLAILGGLGILFSLFLFVKCFAVHTPSSNPYTARAIIWYESVKRRKKRGSHHRSKHRH